MDTKNSMLTTKQKLIVLLNNCLIDKDVSNTINLKKFISLIQDNNTTLASIDHEEGLYAYESLFIDLLDKDRDHLTVLFDSNNRMVFSLKCGCSSNMLNTLIGYDDIKEMLLNK